MLAILAAAVSLFAQSFLGAWTCYVSVPAQGNNPAQVFTSRWMIAAAPADNWTIVRWGPQDGANGGIAYVGYIPAENDWAYHDFHYDGSYALSTSAGPDTHGVWTWAGSFYTSSGIRRGAVAWKATSASRIDRAFFRMIDGKLRQSGSDYCTKR